VYAVIRAGGKQYKVTEGDVIEIEHLGDGAKVNLTPLLVVDDDGTTHADGGSLAKASVTGEVVGESRGPKIKVFKYRNKTGYRRTNGHRQRYSSVKISSIKLSSRRTSKKSTDKESENGT
jgi:large subunit ribosomal protein L21